MGWWVGGGGRERRVFGGRERGGVEIYDAVNIAFGVFRCCQARYWVVDGRCRVVDGGCWVVDSRCWMVDVGW